MNTPVPMEWMLETPKTCSKPVDKRIDDGIERQKTIQAERHAPEMATRHGVDELVRASETGNGKDAPVAEPSTLKELVNNSEPDYGAHTYTASIPRSRVTIMGTKPSTADSPPDARADATPQGHPSAPPPQPFQDGERRDSVIGAGERYLPQPPSQG